VLDKVVLRVAVDPKDKNLKRRGVLIEVNQSVEDQEQMPGLETSVVHQRRVLGLENELQWPEVVSGETQSL
jgi:hypothetical protein